jgi:hypothetical protein
MLSKKNFTVFVFRFPYIPKENESKPLVKSYLHKVTESLINYWKISENIARLRFYL